MRNRAKFCADRSSLSLVNVGLCCAASAARCAAGTLRIVLLSHIALPVPVIKLLMRVVTTVTAFV